MFLQLNHKDLEVYKQAKAVILACHRATTQFPSEEKFSLISQIRRAASSVLINIAEDHRGVQRQKGFGFMKYPEGS